MTNALQHAALDSLLDFAVGMEQFLGWDQVSSSIFLVYTCLKSVVVTEC